MSHSDRVGLSLAVRVVTLAALCGASALVQGTVEPINDLPNPSRGEGHGFHGLHGEEKPVGLPQKDHSS